MQKLVEDEVNERMVSEAQYQGIFDSATDSFLIFDLDGNIVAANPQACTVYGYSHDELITLSGKDIVHPDYYHLFDEFKRAVQKTGEFYTESMDVRKDGTLFNIVVRGREVMYRGKKHLLAVVRDVTECRQAEEKLEAAYRELEATNRQIEELIERANQMALKAEAAYIELDQIFNSTGGGMCVIDKDYNVIRINETFSALFGIRSDTAAGKKCFEVSRNPLCKTPNCPHLRILDGEERVECEVEKELGDGTRIPCILTATPFSGLDGDVVGIIEDFKDITERKRAEESLRGYMGELKRFNRLAVGRELRMIELKREVNRLCERLNEEPPYDLSFVEGKRILTKKMTE